MRLKKQPQCSHTTGPTERAAERDRVEREARQTQNTRSSVLTLYNLPAISMSEYLHDTDKSFYSVILCLCPACLPINLALCGPIMPAVSHHRTRFCTTSCIALRVRSFNRHRKTRKTNQSRTVGSVEKRKKQKRAQLKLPFGVFRSLLQSAPCHVFLFHILLVHGLQV